VAFALLLPRNFTHIGVSLGLAVVVAVGVFTGGRYAQQLIAMAGIWGILVLGYQFSFGHAGALNLAQGAFFGIGAYSSAIVSRAWGLDFTISATMAVGMAMALAALIAAPVLRLKSHYFALATLAIAQLVHLLAVNWQALTGGANGLPGVPGLTIVGIGVPYGAPHLVVIWLLVLAAGLLSRRLTRGSHARAYSAIRQTPLAAGTLGLDAGKIRFRALVIGAGYAGLAGALQAHTLRVVSPEVTHFSVLVVCLTMTVIGGRMSIAGGLLAAMLLTHLPEWVRGFDDYYLVANGAVLLAAVIFAPAGLGGLLGYFESANQRLGRKIGNAAQAVQVAPGGIGNQEATPRGSSLELVDVAKSFGGVRALDCASMALRPQEIVGLIGPNGSGKTTIANIISGLDRPDVGSVIFDGIDIAGWLPHQISRAGIGRTFQTPELDPELTVIEAVLAAGTDQIAAAHWLHHAGFEGDRDALCGSLSLGARRLVELARALTIEPSILILDEPAAGLSTGEMSRFGSVLRELASGGRALIVIDHNMDFLVPICDRLICLDRGRVIADGPVDVVASNTRVRAAYFGDGA
jgi:branched-chain amino acid transport system permease protein